MFFNSFEKLLLPYAFFFLISQSEKEKEEEDDEGKKNIYSNNISSASSLFNFDKKHIVENLYLRLLRLRPIFNEIFTF